MNRGSNEGLATGSDDSGSGSTAVSSRRETCKTCDKPLGNTTGKCFGCGGRTYRSGPREQGHLWKILLGVA